MKLLTTLALLAGGLVATQTAHAALNTFDPNLDFSSAPVTVTFGGASFTFTNPGAPITDTTFSVDAVATTGSGMINTSGGVINSYGAGSDIGPASTPEFTAFPTAGGIPYSIADDFIGASYAGPDGTHYGYFEVNGGLLVSDAFDTTPGVDVTAGAVPEPASFAVLGIGLVGLAAFARRRV